MKLKQFVLLIGAALLALTATAQNERVILNTSPLSRQLLTNTSQLAWLQGLGVNPLMANGGAPNLGYFAFGIVEHLVNNHYGLNPIYSPDGIHWAGGSGYPVIYDPIDDSRDGCLMDRGNGQYFAACTSGDNGGNYSTLWQSTNYGATWFEQQRIYFTNDAVYPYEPYQTWGPYLFKYQGSTYVMATCFTHNPAYGVEWRYCKCTDEAGLTTWGLPSTTPVASLQALNQTPNGAMLYDATGDPNYNCWVAYYECTGIGIAICNTPFGPWTNMGAVNFGSSTPNEGPKVVKLPNGNYRMYVDKYFDGRQAFSESPSLTNILTWSSLTNCTMANYVGHIMPIQLTNTAAQFAALQAATSTEGPLFSPFVANPTWASPSDAAWIDFGDGTTIQYGNGNKTRLEYRYGVGFNLYASNSTATLTAGVDGYVHANVNGFSGNIIQPLSTQTCSYTLLNTDNTILAASPSLTMTLPAITTVPAGRTYTIKQTAATGTTTITAGGTTHIESGTTYTLSAQYKYVIVRSDGSTWWIIGNN